MSHHFGSRPLSYSRRQLNPFAGVLQILATDKARAFSANGVLWRVQVIAERPDHTWRSAAGQSPARQFFNWGMWSPEQGMHKVVANPILDIGAMTEAADALAASLNEQSSQLPFALHDCLEHWACDRDDQPLALLASALDESDKPANRNPRWRALPDGEQAFNSASLDAAGHATGPQAHAAYLETLLGEHTLTTRWFLRQADGSGLCADSNTVLPDQAFPPLGLREHWDDPLAQATVQDYLAWIAPLLLTLPQLDRDTRARLEHQAMARASLVADLHRLYPRIENAELINQARVETRLRRAH